MAVRYITVTPIAKLFKPATRAFGDIAIVGATDTDANGPFKTPVPITNPDSVSHNSKPANSPDQGKPVDDAAWFKGDLGKSVRKAFQQTPGPTTIWAVRTNPVDAADELKNGLTEVAKLNVQIVTIANRPLGAGPGFANRADINLLANHVTTVSRTGGDGRERIGIAMLGKDVTDTAVVTGDMSNERMVLVAHKSDEDAAAAFAGVTAGYEPHISILLKPVGISMDQVFTDAEIQDFDNARINWLTDPLLFPGKGIFAGEGYTLGKDIPYIDIIRTIDDVSFQLKAMLISSIGDLRVSRSGLRTLASQMTAVLEPLKQRGVIEAYDIFLPLLVLLDKPPATLVDSELQQINNAQNSRTVQAIVAVDYAGAIHRLNITLKFE